MKNETEIREKYKAVAEMTEDEQKRLFKLMDAFQCSAQQTLIGGEELLKMCDGCAFKKGTEASNNPMTALTATESLLKDEAFFCHKRFGANGQEKLCNGWINVMNNK